MCVRGHRESVVARRGDDRADLFLGELRIEAVLRDREHTARGGDLDDIGSVLVPLADGLGRLLRTVDHALERPHLSAAQMLAPAVGRVGMPPGGRDRLAGGEDARARHFAGVDGVAQCDAGTERVAEIAYGGEARHERALRVHRPIERDIRTVLAEAVAGAAAAVLAGQVDMHVHQTRHQRRAAQVDDRIARIRRTVARLDGDDAAAVDHDGALGEHALGDAIDDTPGVDQGSGRRRHGREGCRYREHRDE